MEASDQVKAAVQETVSDNVLTCAQAREISERLGVPMKEIGQAADELEVKLRECELGCF